VSAIAFTIEYRVGGTVDPGLKRLAMAFERAGAEVADVGKHILPRVVPVLEAAAGRQFEAEGQGPDVGKWKPLSEAYAAWKAEAFPGEPILQRTGALVSGLVAASAPTANRNITGATLAFGTKDVPYASFHQTGTTHMPSRPPIDLDDEAAKSMRRAVMAGVRDAIKEADRDNFLGLQDFVGDEFEGQAVQSGRRGGRYIMEGKRKVYLKQRGGTEGRGREVIKGKYAPGKKN
jgi:phage gpG-like protein